MVSIGVRMCIEKPVLLLLTFLNIALYASDSIYVVQHSMREKPYNDTLECSWFTFKINMIDSAVYRKNSVLLFKDGKRKRFHRRFYTVIKVDSINKYKPILKRRKCISGLTYYIW